jgi:pimeloyl-ACP methyl ester carboxylesterase
MVNAYRISWRTAIYCSCIFLILIISSMIGYHYYYSPQSTNVVFIFSHGLRQNQHRARDYEKALDVPFNSFDFPDVHNQRETDFAQERDLKKLEECYTKTLATLKPHEGIVLVGVSRGAAATLNFASTHPKQLKGIIVEAPFDNVQSVKTSLLSKFDCLSEPLADSIIQCMFPYYKHDGIQPIESIKLIDPEIPVLIICTEEDIVAPKTCSIRLCDELKNARAHTTKQNTHLALFSKGSHAGLIEEFPVEYRTLFKRFLRFYGLNPKKAIDHDNPHNDSHSHN